MTLKQLACVSGLSVHVSFLKPSLYASVSFSRFVSFLPLTNTLPFLLITMSLTAVHFSSPSFLHHFVRIPKYRYTVLPGLACPLRFLRIVCLLVLSKIIGTNRSLNEYAGIIFYLLTTNIL